MMKSRPFLERIWINCNGRAVSTTTTRSSLSLRRLQSSVATTSTRYCQVTCQKKEDPRNRHHVFSFTRFSTSSSSKYPNQQQGQNQRRAETGSWSSLSPSEQAAWKVFHYNKESWEQQHRPPPWKEWDELSLEEQATAKYGLGVSNQEEWDELAPLSSSSSQRQDHDDISSSMVDIPSLSSLMEEEQNNNNASTSSSDNDKALVVAQETRVARQSNKSGGNGGGLSGTIGNMAYQGIKGLAPIVGPLMKAAGNQTRSGRGAAGLAIAGSLIENLPTIVDSMSGVLEVTGIDTLIYLDDSASMQGSNLVEGQKAFSSLESRLKKNPRGNDQRFLPTRIVKFGQYPTVINPSEEDWNVSLVNTAWDGSSGGTYMWKMIQDDIQSKYKPAGGKLRVIVITDGYDVLSPPPYKGIRGFDPLMKTLLKDGFDIEWNIIVVGNENDSSFFGQPELSAGDKKLYKNLCDATGGQFLSIDSSSTTYWDEDDRKISKFLDGIEDSGYYDSEYDRRQRQEQYRLEANKGKAEKFDWLPKLPDGSKKK